MSSRLCFEPTRATSSWPLTVFHPEHKSLLSDFPGVHTPCGVLRPVQGAALSVKAVCENTARLYLALRQASRLPDFVLRSVGDGEATTIAEMVLDNVLEIAVDESGPVFVSGSDAYEFLYGREEPDADADLGKLAGLSVEALKYAQELPIDDIGILSSRLYFYNRIPASPQWLKTLPTEQAVARLLRIDDEGANRHRLSRAWREASQTPSREGWRVWRRHTRSRERDKDSGALYKLYVSPAPTAIEEAFAETMEAVTLADGRCSRSAGTSTACCDQTSWWRTSTRSANSGHAPNVYRTCSPTALPMVFPSPLTSPEMRCCPGESTLLITRTR